MRRSRTDAIGLIVVNLVNPFFAEMAAGFEEEALHHGFATIISSSAEDADKMVHAALALADRQVDGIIVVPMEETDATLTSIATERPLLLFDHQLGELPAVVASPAAGMRELGHTRVGYLAGPQDTSTGRERLAVFTADTEDLETVIYQGEYRYKEGYVGTIELFESGVTAIIAGDSMMSFGALEACHNAGITIGEELALIGFDDFIFCVSSPRRSASSTRTWRRWDSSQLTHSSPQSTPNPLPLGCGAPRVFSRLSWAYPPTQTERDNVKLGCVSSLGLSQSHTADRTMPPR